jgi:hypothetical protein
LKTGRIKWGIGNGKSGMERVVPLREKVREKG